VSDVTVWQLGIALIAGVGCGFAKAGMATLGIFNAVLMMQAFPAKEAVGILLPILIVADLAAVTLYRRHVAWRHLTSLLPWVLVGIAGGYVLLSAFDDAALRPFLGWMLLTLIGMQLWKDYARPSIRTFAFRSAWSTTSLGALAGFATTVGNVSGAVMSMYLFGKKLPKEAFVGTGAWFYLTVNLIKLPLFIQLGMVSSRTLTVNAAMLPAAAAGMLLGAVVIPRMKQTHFQLAVLLLGAGGALTLALAP